MERNTVESVPVEKLLTDSPYRVRYRLEDEALARSVQDWGVLNPLWVCREKPGYVVAGFKRLHAARQMQCKTVPVQFVSGSGAKELFIRAVVSNWEAGLEELDRTRAVFKAIREFDFTRREVKAGILPALGMGPDERMIDESLAVMELAPGLVESAARGNLPFRGLSGLRVLEPGDQHFFAESIVPRAKLTSSQLIKVTEWLLRIMKRDGISLRDLIETEYLPHTSKKRNPDRKQEGERLFRLVRRLHHPHLSEVEDTFRRRAASIEKKGSEVRLEPPPFFEEQGFFLKAHLRNRDSLEELIHFLKQEKPGIRTLFDIVL